MIMLDLHLQIRSFLQIKKSMFAGKIFIMVMAVPILISLMDLMINMVP